MTRAEKIATVAASEVYVENARGVHVGYFGRDELHRWRCRCYGCNLESPLTDSDPIWGEYPDRASRDVTCDSCGRILQEIADDQQAAHDMQQTRWARESRIDHVIEMGATAGIRCRVY